MALIKCPECEKEISDKAASCPNCGCPMKTHISEGKEETLQKEEDNSSAVNNESIQNDNFLETDTQQEKSPKKPIGKKAKIIAISAIGILIIGGIVAYVLTDNLRNYNNAQKLVSEKQFDAAATAFGKLGDYKDSVTQYQECQYKYATQLFLNEKYKEAESIFKELGDYQDSKVQYDICQYRQSGDWEFIVLMKTGLENRWDISEKDYSGTSDAEYTKYLKECIDSELEELNKADLDSINSEKLQVDAANYIKILNNSLEAANYYVTDANQYYTLWNAAYSDRVLLIRKFINDYGLVIDGKYEDIVDEFLSSAQAVDQTKALEADVNNMIGNFTVELAKDEYGTKTYILTMENTTEVTFEYFGVTVDFLDDNDTIVYSQYSGEAKDFAPGQKAQFDIYTNKEYTSLKYHPNYSKKS